MGLTNKISSLMANSKFGKKVIFFTTPKIVHGLAEMLEEWFIETADSELDYDITEWGVNVSKKARSAAQKIVVMLSEGQENGKN